MTAQHIGSTLLGALLVLLSLGTAAQDSQKSGVADRRKPHSDKPAVHNPGGATETEIAMVAAATECDPGSCEVRVMASYHSACAQPFATGTFAIAN